MASPSFFEEISEITRAARSTKELVYINAARLARQHIHHAATQGRSSCTLKFSTHAPVIAAQLSADPQFEGFAVRYGATSITIEW